MSCMRVIMLLCAAVSMGLAAPSCTPVPQTMVLGQPLAISSLGCTGSSPFAYAWTPRIYRFGWALTKIAASPERVRKSTQR